MFGQQVGFCQGSQMPYGYSCQGPQLAQEVIEGTLVADGNGNVTSGNYTQTQDPNETQCSSKNNAAPSCPYQVPSGTTWSNSTSYVVGNEVDYVAGGKTLTYQAVKSNTDVTPSGANVCTSKTIVKNPLTCTWVELYASANGYSDGGSNGTLTGTYTVQSNGTGTLQLTPTSSKGNQTVVFDFLVFGASAVGQQIPLVALPQLGNGNTGNGTALRVN